MRTHMEEFEQKDEVARLRIKAEGMSTMGLGVDACFEALKVAQKELGKTATLGHVYHHIAEKLLESFDVLQNQPEVSGVSRIVRILEKSSRVARLHC